MAGHPFFAATAATSGQPTGLLERRLLADARRRQRAKATGRVLTVVDPPAAAIGDGPWDTIVCDLALCRADDPVAALVRLRDALADGGRLLLLEHVRARPPLGWAQPGIEPAWRAMTGGCHLTRDLGPAVRAAGLVIVEQRWLDLPAPLGLALEATAIVRRRPSAG